MSIHPYNQKKSHLPVEIESTFVKYKRKIQEVTRKLMSYTKRAKGREKIENKVILKVFFLPFRHPTILPTISMINYNLLK